MHDLSKLLLSINSSGVNICRNFSFTNTIMSLSSSLSYLSINWETITFVSGLIFFIVCVISKYFSLLHFHPNFSSRYCLRALLQHQVSFLQMVYKSRASQLLSPLGMILPSQFFWRWNAYIRRVSKDNNTLFILITRTFMKRIVSLFTSRLLFRLLILSNSSL